MVKLQILKHRAGWMYHLFKAKRAFHLKITQKLDSENRQILIRKTLGGFQGVPNAVLMRTTTQIIPNPDMSMLHSFISPNSLIKWILSRVKLGHAELQKVAVAQAPDHGSITDDTTGSRVPRTLVMHPAGMWTGGFRFSGAFSGNEKAPADLAVLPTVSIKRQSTSIRSVQ